MDSITETSVASSGFSLRLGLASLALAYWIYSYWQGRQANIANQAIGAQHGCKPLMRRVPFKWPLSIDLLYEQYKALQKGRLLAAQAEVFEKAKVGQTFEVKLLGAVGLLTFDPLNLKAMLEDNFEDWFLGSRRPSIFPLIGEGIFTQDGHQWLESRRLLSGPFKRIARDKELKIYEEPMDDLLSGLRASKGVVDLQHFFFRFTLSTTTSLIFGEPFAGLDVSDHENFQNNFDAASLTAALRSRLSDVCWLWTPPSFLKQCKDVKAYANKYVEFALSDIKANGTEDAKTRHEFIVELYEELKDPLLVRDQLLNVLIAGRDTTACLMSWAVYQIVRHPRVLARLKEEINTNIPTNTAPTRADIKKLSFLACILNETNRLYSQVPINVRTATKTTVLPRGGGADGLSPILIPKGMGVGFSPYHMHRQTSIFGPDAHTFRPERWEGEEGEHLRSLGPAFMPFHWGKRICLGKDFALTEASYGIVRILQTFPDIRMAPGEEVMPSGQEQQSVTFVVLSREGCKVLLS